MEGDGKCNNVVMVRDRPWIRSDDALGVERSGL